MSLCGIDGFLGVEFDSFFGQRHTRFSLSFYSSMSNYIKDYPSDQRRLVTMMYSPFS